MRVGQQDRAPDQGRRARVAQSVQAILRGERNDRILILESEGAPAALTWIEIRTYPEGFDGHHDPEMWPELIGKLGAQFRNTNVLEPHRRKGIAQWLKLRAEHAARQADAAFLYTRCIKTNRAMLAINEKLGYEIVPEEGDYMRLRKKLAPEAW